MTVANWCEAHKDDVIVKVTHPKTKAGRKTDMELIDIEHRFSVFRETVRTKFPSEEEICKFLDDMYVEFLNKRAIL